MQSLIIKFLILICVLFTTTAVVAQTNLLNQEKEKNKYWRYYPAEGVTIEKFDGDEIFVVRNSGRVFQDVDAGNAAIGKYALFIGLISSELADTENKTTSKLSPLYVYMMQSGGSKQSQKLRNEAQDKNDWVVIYGIFQVQKNTGLIRFTLIQPEQSELAARFNKLGLFLFETEKDALEFAKAYK